MIAREGSLSSRRHNRGLEAWLMADYTIVLRRYQPNKTDMIIDRHSCVVMRQSNIYDEGIIGTVRCRNIVHTVKRTLAI